ncbi:Nitrilase/cyanide hydratase and apolipo protein N acyltransferase [Hesseltinella vesiculosa]|uniref:Nitrilase/cyanide hydratase and apolipo protein N acyltransferase n=1 Tax=Hesseltinella vesiculosa TaxID=101127 RepID=A0A1X2GWW8_9FUNG|nr:Nitrilase/cyanide hydratase and apolipo protein N acyltransferase [Hesseltinella vesiculosa]
MKVAAVQFENKNGDKKYNLDLMERYATEAKSNGCQVISFNECCIPGYTFAKRLTYDELLEVAEFVPDGPSVQALMDMSTRLNIAILAGLYEKDSEGKIYNTYVCVHGQEFVAKFRKLHPFISKFLSPGDSYVVFDLFGWKCGILICYDNNVIENVRATTLLGAEVIFMPHVTGCTPSKGPGRGFVDPKLWEQRHVDPVRLRQELDGPKSRGWLMKWLPARAYDNGIYAVFTNPIGMDDDQLKGGHAMVIDPFGEIIAECRDKLDDDMCVSVLTKEKLEAAGGYRYRNARRLELYKDIFNKDHDSTFKVSWL